MIRRGPKICSVEGAQWVKGPKICRKFLKNVIFWTIGKNWGCGNFKIGLFDMKLSFETPKRKVDPQEKGFFQAGWDFQAIDFQAFLDPKLTF